MDTDVVLNAIFDTYSDNEKVKIARAKKVLLEPRKIKLFENGVEFASIVELTMNQTRRGGTPIYAIGNAIPISFTPKVPNDSMYGMAIMDITESAFRHFTHNINEMSDSIFYHIEAETVFSDGSINKIQINHLYFNELCVNSSTNRATFNYQGSFKIVKDSLWT